MLTTEQILALSPDDSSAKAAKGLLAPAKWPTLGFDDAAIWGECQGSGSKPYQTCIDIGGPTFKCTCPSRKFPCKHGLALYLLRAQKEGAFTAKQAPPWVSEWMSGRKERAEKKAEKQAAQEAGVAAAPPDPAATAKREAKRLDRMIAGARDLERWLADLIKHGIGELPARPASFWRDVSARLVDAQASGLASGVRQLEALVHSGAGWPERAIAHMGRMQLLIDAMSRLEELPENLRTEVRTACGWPMEREEVLASGEHLTDQWMVCGQSFEENERLWERRVWLKGAKSGRHALLLDFSHGQRRYEQGYVSGSVFEATLAYFPGNHPLRALLVDAPRMTKAAGGGQDFASESWDAALGEISNACARNPWLPRLPLGMSQVVPAYHDGQWTARDVAGREARLRVSADDAWELAALSGGRALTIFGEWNGEQWRPLAAWTNESSQIAWTETVAVSS
ncbi:MAG: SWIM zinc finger family protein [Roseimicrobium sp.]